MRLIFGSCILLILASCITPAILPENDRLKKLVLSLRQEDPTLTGCIDDLIKCRTASVVCINNDCVPRWKLHTGSCTSTKQCPFNATCLWEEDDDEYKCACQAGYKQLTDRCRDLSYYESNNDCCLGQSCKLKNCEFDRHVSLAKRTGTTIDCRSPTSPSFSS